MKTVLEQPGWASVDYPPIPPPVTPLGADRGVIEAGYELFRGEVLRQERHWRKKEPETSALMGSLGVAMTMPRDIVSQTIREFIGVRRVGEGHMLPSEAVGIFRAWVQSYALREYSDDQLMEGVRLPDTAGGWWGKAHEAVLFHHLEGEGSGDLFSSHAQTTIPSRQGPLHIVLRALGAERVLDAGCGIGVGAFQSVFNNIVPFDRVDAFVQLPDDSCVKPRGFVSSMNGQLLTPPKVQRYALTDAIDPRGKPNQRWAISCLRPSELANPKFMGKVQTLLNLGLAALGSPAGNLVFEVGDITSSEGMDRFKKHPRIKGLKFNVIVLSTVMDQIFHSFDETIANLGEFLEPGGVFVMQDFAYSTRENRFGGIKRPHMFKKWHGPYRYGAYAYDPEHPECGWQLLYRAQESRCSVICVKEGSIALRGMSVSRQGLFTGTETFCD